MPEQSLQEIEEQIEEAEDDIRTVRGEQQLEALKKQKKRKLKKKQREAKLKQTKTGRVISNLSQEIGQLFEQTERLDADGRNDASKEILIEAGTATKNGDEDEDPADAITGEVEIEGTLEIEDADIETEGRQTEPEQDPLGASGLPPAMEQLDSENDDDENQRGPTGLPRSGFL